MSEGLFPSGPNIVSCDLRQIVSGVGEVGIVAACRGYARELPARIGEGQLIAIGVQASHDPAAVELVVGLHAAAVAICPCVDVGRIGNDIIGARTPVPDIGVALRRLSGLTNAAGLEALRQKAMSLLAARDAKQMVHELAKAIDVQGDHLLLTLDPSALMPGDEIGEWAIRLPLLERKPHKEARLRIDPEGISPGQVDASLVRLLREAFQVRELVTNSPELAIAEIAKREGRCRKQMTKLLRLSWISPRIVETILEGRQPASLTRNRLLNLELPIEWDAQERLLRIAS